MRSSDGEVLFPDCFSACTVLDYVQKNRNERELEYGQKMERQLSCGERHLQRRFLRKHGAVVGVLALSVTAYAVPPLAKPYTLHFSRKLHRHAKGSPFGRAGA